MRANLTRLTVICLFSFIVFHFETAPAAAETIASISSIAPTIDGADIANLGVTQTWLEDGDVRDVYSNRPAQGQTFTTGTNPSGYLLKAITMRNCDYAKGVVGNFRLQVGAVDGSVLTPIICETTSNSGYSILANQYVTITLANPVSLYANTVYGFDWVNLDIMDGINTATSGGNLFSGGGAYSSGANAVPDNNNLSFNSGIDRIFHLDIQSIPEPSSIFLLATGIVTLVVYAWRRKR